MGWNRGIGDPHRDGLEILPGGKDLNAPAHRFQPQHRRRHRGRTEKLAGQVGGSDACADLHISSNGRQMQRGVGKTVDVADAARRSERARSFYDLIVHRAVADGFSSRKHAS